MKGILRLLVIALILSGISACQHDAGILTLSSDLDKDYGLAFMDTTTLVTSTILLDSIPTSAVGPVMFGKYTDPKLGQIEAQSYFQVAPSGLWTFGNGESQIEVNYESAYLILEPSGYYYGDTTKSQTIEVRQISQDFRTFNLNPFWLNEKLYSYFSLLPNKLYNTSKIGVGDLLGTTTFKIPNVINDSITVKLDDDLGQAWFQMAKNNAKTIQSTASFVNNFKGIAIRSINESNIMAIAPSKKTGAVTAYTKIRIYYNESDAGVFTEKYFDFNFFNGFYGSGYNPDNNFTKVDAIRAGTLIEDLSPQHNEIPSSLTNDETYVQADAGVATKIKMPSLRNILNIPGFLKINSAKLILEPIKGTYNSSYSLPASLTLFYGKGNYPYQQVAADFSSRLLQAATISVNSETNNTSGYQFSLTQMIQTILEGKNDDLRDFSLIVTLPPSQMESEVNRVVLGGGVRSNYRARLEIYYLKQNQ
jgi:hypothetical protein